MTYRSILVVLDGDADNDDRVTTAIGMALRLDCHLVGLAPTGRDVLSDGGWPASTTTTADFPLGTTREPRQAARQRAEAFDKKCQFVGLPSFEVIVHEAEMAISVVRHARCSDLCILSQPKPGMSRVREVQDLLNQAVQMSARPTLILPSASSDRPIGRSVLVAWDDSRQAARALQDALPILRQAEEVEIVCWNEAGTPCGLNLQVDPEALTNWLAWQGVDAEAHLVDFDRGIAEAILARAQEQRADLLVMGSHRTPPWVDSMPGGAAFGPINRVDLPVLLSH